MERQLLHVILTIVTYCVSNADANDDTRQYVGYPTAGVKLVRPRGFEDAENFHGFQQQSTQSSVMAMMIPGPFLEVTRGFTDEQLKTRGMTLLSKESIKIDGYSGMLVGVSQTAYGTKYTKWIVAFGDDKKTRLVTAVFPSSKKRRLSDELKAVVLSARADESPPPPSGSDVGFEIVASSRLKLTKGIGKMLMYTRDGAISKGSPGDPLFIAAPSLSKIEIDDQRQFAMQRLLQTGQTRISSVRFNSEITIDGLVGYEMVASGEDADSGTPLSVYQVILYDGGSYILMQGLVGSELLGEYLPEFKAMARSLTLRDR